VLNRKNFRLQNGFTLIEVLVALTIVAVALGASLRAVGAMTNNSQHLQSKLYASWSAENRLAELRLAGVAPPNGVRDFACPQGRLPFHCVEEVRPTPNVYMRRIVLQIYADAGRSQHILTVNSVMPDR
jgi:general secretion pathway protein I